MKTLFNTGLAEGKAKALENYKKAKAELKYKNGLIDFSAKEWKTYCLAERECKMWGVRI